MTGPKSPPTLDDLAERLKKAREVERRAEGPEAPSANRPRTAIGMAFRVSVELVSGVLVGAGIGYALDRWLGTLPWLSLLFFVLGVAGGMMNVWRLLSGKGLAAGYAGRKDGGDRHRDGGTTRER